MRLLLAWSRKTLSQTIGQFRAGETIGPAPSQSATPMVSEARRLRAADTVPVASWPVWLGPGGRGDSDYWLVSARLDYPAAPSRLASPTLSRTIGQFRYWPGSESDSESDSDGLRIAGRCCSESESDYWPVPHSGWRAGRRDYWLRV